MNFIIYGLPRSGTNYLEYLIRENLICNYENKYVENENRYFFDKGKISLKHCKPDYLDGDKFIIIIKKYGNFIKSFKIWSKFNNDKIRNIYNDSLKHYYEFYKLNSSDTIIVFHDELINNEIKFISIICNKFHVEQKNKTIIIPKKNNG